MRQDASDMPKNGKAGVYVPAFCVWKGALPRPALRPAVKAAILRKDAKSILSALQQ